MNVTLPFQQLRSSKTKTKQNKHKKKPLCCPALKLLSLSWNGPSVCSNKYFGGCLTEGDLRSEQVWKRVPWCIKVSYFKGVLAILAHLLLLNSHAGRWSVHFPLKGRKSVSQGHRPNFTMVRGSWWFTETFPFLSPWFSADPPDRHHAKTEKRASHFWRGARHPRKYREVRRRRGRRGRHGSVRHGRPEKSERHQRHQDSEGRDSRNSVLESTHF